MPDIVNFNPKTTDHRHKGVSVGKVNSKWLSKLVIWLSKLRLCAKLAIGFQISRPLAGPEGRSGGRREERSDERRPPLRPSSPARGREI